MLLMIMTVDMLMEWKFVRWSLNLKLALQKIEYFHGQ